MSWMPVRYAVAAALMAVAAACDDGAVKSESGAKSETDRDTSASATAGQDWLSVSDRRRPGPWLARRDHPVASNDVGGDASGQYAVYGKLLQHLGDYYHESPRMIANRVAQMHDEVAPHTPGLTHRALLTDFAWQAGNEREQTLGEVVQHYLVLRQQGADHAGAIAQIRAAYEAIPDGE